MALDKFQIKERADYLYNELRGMASTFIYNPDKIEKIRKCIFDLQDQCNHEYQNGRCIYCRKEEK